MAHDETVRRFRPPRIDFAKFQPQHFRWQLDGKVATVTLNRPERKNPLTLESYGELRDTFRDLAYADTIRSVVITGAGGNFCSGGDVHEIIGPLVEMQRKGDAAGLLAFTSPGSTTPVLADGVLPGDRLGITVEPAGGTPQPTTTPVVVMPVA